MKSRHADDCEEVIVAALHRSAAIIQRRRIGFAIASGLSDAMRHLFAGSLVALFAVAFCTVLNIRISMLAWVTGLAILALPAFVLIRRHLTLALKDPGHGNVAERLDLALGDQNSLATALDLIRREVRTPMAEAAIESAMDVAHNLKHVSPAKEPSKAIRFGYTPGLLIVVWIFIAFLAKYSFESISQTTSNALVQNVSEASIQPATLPARADFISTAKTNTTTNSNMVHLNSSRPNTNQPGSAKLGNSGPSAAGNSSAGAASGSAGDGGSSQGGRREEQSRPISKSTSIGSNSPLQSGGGGAVGAGAGGGGVSVAVQNEVASHESTEIKSEAESVGDSPEIDQNMESKHRTGAQPILEDRVQSPTRDLALGGLKGTPGTGRGGPTPTKKSRGAGALLLGVPMPDFISGKLQPGTSKMTRQSMSATEEDNPDRSAAYGAPRRGDENPIHRFDPSPADASLVSRYLELSRKAQSESTDDSGQFIPTDSQTQGVLSK